MEGVEGVEELLLGGGLARDEVDIVDEQNVAGAVLVAELGHGLAGHGVDHLVGEVLALDVDDPHVGDLLLQLVGDGVEQVGLTQTAGAVDEERIVGLGGAVGHGDTGGVGELIGGAYDEVVKGVLEIEGGEGGADAGGLEGILLGVRLLLSGLCHSLGGGLFHHSLHEGGLVGGDDGSPLADQGELDLKAQHFREAALDIGLIFGSHHTDLDLGFGLHGDGRALEIHHLQAAQPQIGDDVAQLGAEGFPHQMPDLGNVVDISHKVFPFRRIFRLLGFTALRKTGNPPLTHARVMYNI